MGSAIAGRINSKYDVLVFDKDKTKTVDLKGVGVAEDILGLVKNSEIIILAVKPQDFDIVLPEIKGYSREKLIISIAAGITTEYIEKVLGEVRVIRVMPNLPARFGEGVSCICRGKLSTKKDLSMALDIFRYLGSAFILSEYMMNAATAVSGSGPAYIFDFLEREHIDLDNIPNDKLRNFEIEFKEAAELLALPKKEAHRLVEATIRGSLATLQASEMVPSQLIQEVASKGGTTEAALEVLHNGGTLVDAVKAAAKRAEELSKT